MKKIILAATVTMLLFTACTAKTGASAIDSNVVISNAGKVVYKADSFSGKEQRLNGVYIVVRNDDMSLRGVVRSDYADWRGSKWELTNPTQYTSEEDGLFITPVDPEILAGLNEPPEAFRRMTPAANPAALLKSNSVTKTKDSTVVAGDVDGQTVSGLVFFDMDETHNQRIIAARKAAVSIPGDKSALMQFNMSDVTVVSFDPQKSGDYEVITSEEVNRDFPW